MTGSDNNDPCFIDIDETIKPEMYRFDCPSPLELGEYQLDICTPLRKKEINDHLASCPYCREELHYIREFIKTPLKNCGTETLPEYPAPETSPEPGSYPSLVIPFKNEIIYHDRTAPLEAARGDESDYESRKITIKLDNNQSLVMFYTLHREEKFYILKGQFVPDILLEKRLNGALVEIWQDNTIRTMTFVDDLYAFIITLHNLTPFIIRVSDKLWTLLSAKLDVTR